MSPPNAESLSSLPQQRPLHERAMAAAQKNPMLALGLVGGVSVLGYMIKGFSSRNPNMKPSVYLIHTRLAVQSTIIGMLSIGMIYQIYDHHVRPALQSSKMVNKTDK